MDVKWSVGDFIYRVFVSEDLQLTLYKVAFGSDVLNSDPILTWDLVSSSANSSTSDAWSDNHKVSIEKEQDYVYIESESSMKIVLTLI